MKKHTFAMAAALALALAAGAAQAAGSKGSVGGSDGFRSGNRGADAQFEAVPASGCTVETVQFLHGFVLSGSKLGIGPDGRGPSSDRVAGGKAGVGDLRYAGAPTACALDAS